MYSPMQNVSLFPSVEKEYEEDAGGTSGSDLAWEGRSTATTWRWFRDSKRMIGAIVLLVVGIVCGAKIPYKTAPDHPHTLRTQLHMGVSKIAELFPEDAAQLNHHRDAIVGHIINMTSPEADSPLRRLVTTGALHMADTPLEVPESINRRLMEGSCDAAVAWFIADLLMFVVNLLGMVIPNQDNFKDGVAAYYQQHLDAQSSLKLANEIKTFQKSEGVDKLFTVWGIIAQSWSATGVFKMLFVWLRTHAIDPWKWVEAVVVSAARCTQWFASAPAGFVAHVIMSLGGRIDAIAVDSVKAVDICFGVG